MQETKLQSTIESVNIFKNGLTIVREYVEPTDENSFVIRSIQNLVHGTFWLDNPDMSVALIRRKKEVIKTVIPEVRGIDSLFGFPVAVSFHHENNEIIDARGVILGRIHPTDANMLMRLEGSSDIISFNAGNLKKITALPVESPEQRVEYLLRFSGHRDLERVYFNYVTSGLTWAPAYNLELTYRGDINIRLQATIRNDFRKLEAVEVGLISGFPNIQFGGVLSLLDQDNNKYEFFNQIENSDNFPKRFSSYKSGFSPIGTSGTQKLRDMYKIEARHEAYLGRDTGSSDLHRRSIGRISLNAGETVQAELASARADVVRVVEWFIPDTRRIDGTITSGSKDSPEEAVWDAAVFRNPFTAPLTTAPAQIVEQGQFKGQSSLFWTDPGEKTFIRIARALSFRTRAREEEEREARDVVRFAGKRFQSTNVRGMLSIENRRSEPVTVMIRRRFVGRLLEADLQPQTVLREDGVTVENDRNELLWEFQIAPQEEKKISYRYNVLVLMGQREEKKDEKNEEEIPF